MVFLIPFACAVAIAQTATTPELLLQVPGTGPIAAFEDRDGDGLADVLISRQSPGTGLDLVSGATGQVLVSFPSGAAVTSIDDFNGDGVRDVVTASGIFLRVRSGKNAKILWTVTAQLTGCYQSTMRWVAALDGPGPGTFLYAQTDTFVNDDGSYGVIQGSGGGVGTPGGGGNGTGSHLCSTCDDCGASNLSGPVAGLGDVDGDGKQDYAVAHGSSTCAIDDRVEVRSAAGCGLIGLLDVDNLKGAFVARLGDLDGDGLGDLLVAGHFGGEQRVRAYQGFGFEPTLLRDFGPQPGFVNICSPGDVDCDGVPDVLIGLPSPPLGGVVRLYSGATGALLTEIFGTDVGVSSMGREAAPAGDVDGDGVADWMVEVRNGTVDEVWIYSGIGPDVATYCTGKTNSAGCTPAIDTTGLPAASGPDDFLLTARDVLAQKPGLFFWGTDGRVAVPFFGGTLCVLPPLTRGPILTSQGPADCSAGYAFFFDQAYALTNGVEPGDVVNGQFWMRDPAQPDGTGVGLTDGVEFEWCP